MKFTDGELKVMQLLWQHGELKPSQLQELFPEPIKNPALRSYLTILHDKGHVKRRKVGKAFLYSAKTKKQRAYDSMLGQLVDTFFSGSMRQLIVNLVEGEKLTEADIAELRQAASVHTSNPVLASKQKRRKTS